MPREVAVASLITFKDFCIDAVDPMLLGAFWRDALGLGLEELDDGDIRLFGDSPNRVVWINRVPESKTVKQRVHLNVHGSVASFITLGATPLDTESFDWAVLADPEGGEFCVFPGPDQVRPRVVDCADASALADWWGTAFDVEPGAGAASSNSLRGIPGCPFAVIGFVEVPEPKTVKNRIHIDARTRSLDELRDHGATLLRRQDDEIEWNVMADPEGNEFCAWIS